MADGRPMVEAVAVEGVFGAPQRVDAYSITSRAQDDLATQLHDIAAANGSKIASLCPDRVIVRRADRASIPSQREGPKTRLMAEGALAADARERVSDVRLLSGRDVGRASPPATKEALEAHAESTLPGCHVAAAAAAVGGLAL